MTASTMLREHYRSLFAEHGDGPEVAQLSAEGQRFRFEKLFEIADLDGASVLDVGSNLGAMYPQLRSRYPGARYEGIDIVPEVVACAARKYPEVRFRTHNLLDGPIPETHDYVLMSGIFNNASPSSTPFLEELVERAWAHAGRGLGFNFLSNHVNFAQQSMSYHDPVRVLDFCLTRLTRKIRMDHHYDRCDVAVFLYR